MKEYLNRVLSGSKKIELCYWWILRLIMIYAFINAAIHGQTQRMLQVFGNLIGMFAWEIMQAMPAKNCLRHIKPYIQDLTIFGFFMASFGGEVLNLYYTFSWYDTLMHFVGGGVGVWFGYEIVTAMQKRDKKTAPVPILLLCAFGFSFVVSTGWELFEFVFDQFFGGDAQHWSYELAVDSGMDKTLFDPHSEMRFALIDTMTDIVFNTLGAIIFYILLKFVPYMHRGKNDTNREIELALAAESKEKETVSVA